MVHTSTEVTNLLWRLFDERTEVNDFSCWWFTSNTDWALSCVDLLHHVPARSLWSWCDKEPTMTSDVKSRALFGHQFFFFFFFWSDTRLTCCDRIQRVKNMNQACWLNITIADFNANDHWGLKQTTHGTWRSLLQNVNFICAVCCCFCCCCFVVVVLFLFFCISNTRTQISCPAPVTLKKAIYFNWLFLFVLQCLWSGYSKQWH